MHTFIAFFTTEHTIFAAHTMKCSSAVQTPSFSPPAPAPTPAKKTPAAGTITNVPWQKSAPFFGHNIPRQRKDSFRRY